MYPDTLAYPGEWSTYTLLSTLFRNKQNWSDKVNFYHWYRVQFRCLQHLWSVFRWWALNWEPDWPASICKKNDCTNAVLLRFDSGLQNIDGRRFSLSLSHPSRRTNRTGQGHSLNRSQCGGCSTKYDTPSLKSSGLLAMSRLTTPWGWVRNKTATAKSRLLRISNRVDEATTTEDM